MSKDDVVVVCVGSNDINKNSAMEGLRNILNFVMGTNHTNIIVMKALCRHDLADWSCVSKEVRLFNRHLTERLKIYNQVSIISANLGRQHFTRHGQHINTRGKDRLC
jgi:transposase